MQGHKSETPYWETRRAFAKRCDVYPSRYTTTLRVVQMTLLSELFSSTCGVRENMAGSDGTSRRTHLSTHLEFCLLRAETCYETGDTSRKHD